MRPTLVTEDALPAAYLRRLVLANERWVTTTGCTGSWRIRRGRGWSSRSGTSTANRPAPEEIARHFVTAGFEQVNAKTFYRRARNLLVSDAHTANVFRTTGGRRAVRRVRAAAAGRVAAGGRTRAGAEFRRLGGGAADAEVLKAEGRRQKAEVQKGHKGSGRPFPKVINRICFRFSFCLLPSTFCLLPSP